MTLICILFRFRNLKFALMKLQWLEDVNKVINNDPSPDARRTYREFYNRNILDGISDHVERQARS